MHRWSKARGVLGQFFPVTSGILATALGDSRTSRRSPSSLELLSVHRHHWTALALLCPPPSPRRPEGKERRPADAERPGCAGCLAQSDGLNRDERPHVGHHLVTRAILVTALVTTLVTRFSPNSYVFL